MDNFLMNNQDYAIHPQISERPKKTPSRLSTVVSLCVLVMVVCFGVSAGGVYLSGWLSGAEFFASEQPSTHDPDNVSLLNIERGPEGRRIIPEEELNVVIEGNLAINTNEVELSPRELFRKVSDGVVGIEIATRTTGGRFTPVETDVQLVGSGFMFTTDGYVLTNEHVIADSVSIYVLVDDYFDSTVIHRYEAEIVGQDRSTDLAVLKISRTEPFRALPIGDSSSLEVGQFVCPIGFPLGLEKSMTFGVISGLNREFDDAGWELSSIQFDAAVNSGNSGGPLFDMYGNVVGIVNKKLVFSNLIDNIGLAITIDEAKPIINDLLLHGTVMSRPMLGVSNLAVLNEQNAALYGFDGITSGILVLAIHPDAPAYHSNLAVGDIIVEVNGVTVESVTDVQTQIRGLQPGDTVDLTVVRFSESGNQRRLVVELELVNSAELD